MFLVFGFFFGQEAASNTTRATSFFQGSLENLAWCAPCWSCGDCLGILAQPSFCFTDPEAQRGQSCSGSDSRTGHVSFSLPFLLQDASLSPPHSFSRCLFSDWGCGEMWVQPSILASHTHHLLSPTLGAFRELPANVGYFLKALHSELGLYKLLPL